MDIVKFHKNIWIVYHLHGQACPFPLFGRRIIYYKQNSGLLNFILRSRLLLFCANFITEKRPSRPETGFKDEFS